MSTLASPYGLEPVGLTGSHYVNGGYSEFALTTNNTTAIAMYDLVALVGGSIAPVSASPTTTLSANTPIGVFMGCSYIDPVMGFVNRAFLPANAVTAGLTSIKIKVVDNPATIFKVQADGSVPATALGKNAALVIGTPDLVNGISRSKVQASSVATTSSLAVRIVGFSTNPTNAVGDAFTDVFVRFNAGVHAYNQGTAQ